MTDFESEVLERSRHVPVLADFWAPWCGPCRMLAPVLDRIATEAGGRWVLAKVNVDEHPIVAEEQKISGIPAIKLFVNGAVVAGFEGALPEPKIREFLNQHVPSPAAGDLKQARAWIEDRRFSDAAPVLERLLAAEPANDAARVALAECRLAIDPNSIAALLETVSVESPLAGKAGALRSLARFAALTENSGSLPESPVKVRYLQAAAALRSADFAAALEGFIDVLARRRDYDQQGPKIACQGIFMLLGIRHPLSEKFHRAFSSALHS